MTILKLHLTILMCACLTLVFQAAAEEVSAARKKPSTSAPVLAAKQATKLPMEQEKAIRPASKKTGTPSLPNRQTEVLPSQPRQARVAFKAENSTGFKRLKSNKRGLSKAALRPKDDLRSHGMLETSQRYDPRANHRTVGIQDPQISGLAHDHFQELDRNQDGKIDPIERAFSRLDIDRDLPNRQP